jgi:putative flippase GtrA
MSALHILAIRFGIVGLTSNLVLYLLYLGLIFLRLVQKFSMSLIYIFGILQTFVLNKKWTFSHHGYLRVAFVRYIGIYAVGHLINLGVLMVMLDRLGSSHEWVQGITVLMVGVLLFAMQRAWVFRYQGGSGE